MNALLKAIGYRSSKSDRSVLKWAFIISSLAAFVIGLAVLFVLWDGLWGAHVQRDSVRFDFVLAHQRVDTVEFVYPGATSMVTNAISGEEVQKLLASFHRTNRLAVLYWSKGQVQSVRFRSGTNLVCWLHLGEDGSWSFGKYNFRVRQ